MELQIAEVASLIGEPVRAKILWTLLDGRAYTASELAFFADTTPQNASIHLGKLLKADLLKVSSQGRHRYYHFSNHEVAYAIEAMANLIPPHKIRKKTPDEYSGVRFCRTCYDHLAGKVGVLINEALLKKEIIVESGTIYEVSACGEKWFLNLGLDIQEVKAQRRTFSKPCLDWSERRYHMAGALGSAFLERLLALDWLRRIKNSRAVSVTSSGQTSLYDQLGITFELDIS